MAGSLPFTSSIMTVKNDWIDYNGHLNMAYYNVLFDTCVDEVHDELGLGLRYRQKTNVSTFSAEAHIIYLAELLASDPVVITCHLIDANTKALHSFLEMRHADKGTVSAVSEQMHLHVDLQTKRVVPFPDSIQRKVDTMVENHKSLAHSPHIGRVMGIRR